SSTPQPEAFVVSQIQTVSSHKLDQPAWAVHLAALVAVDVTPPSFGRGRLSVHARSLSPNLAHFAQEPSAAD
ncbi:hypothetical protein, partial [Streptomyces sp. NPDC127084]|uniref:hypothetical protein n=1 Tax=Streptomyces sp. NPDC127084 TaxID=3347133 RepID=UPI00364E099F